MDTASHRREPGSLGNPGQRPGWKRKIVTPQEAVALLRPGQLAYVGLGCARPGRLIRALAARGWRLAGHPLFPRVEEGPSPPAPAAPGEPFAGKGLEAACAPCEACPAGWEAVPIALSQVPRLILHRHILVDAALIQVSPPDDHGFVSLGISVDLTRSVVQQARTVIAEINPHMPRTCGETLLPVDKIDRMVLTDCPLLEYRPEPPDPVSHRIARQTARLISSGATLRAGPGRIPWEVLCNLRSRRNLRVHADAVTEPVADLLACGAIPASPGGADPARIVTAACLGTRRLYEQLQDNPVFSFHPIEHVCDPSVLCRQPGLVCITQAESVDLTGQVRLGPGDAPAPFGCLTETDFLRGAGLSPGGRPIVCLPSASHGDRASRILPFLPPGGNPPVPCADVHYVVTEFGAAYLFGLSLQERARALIRIAHPAFRAWLEQEARGLGLLGPEACAAQPVAPRAPAPDAYHRIDGVPVCVRRTRPGDVEMLRDLLRTASAEDVSTRYFANLQSLAVNTAEHLCAEHGPEEGVLVGVASSGPEPIIAGCICYWRDPGAHLAEAAALVRPPWRGKGLGSALLRRLVELGRSLGLTGLRGDMPHPSPGMLRVLEKSGCTVSSRTVAETRELTLLFGSHPPDRPPVTAGTGGPAAGGCGPPRCRPRGPTGPPPWG